MDNCYDNQHNRHFHSLTDCTSVPSDSEFLEGLNETLLNSDKNLIGTTCIVMYMAGSNLQPHYIELPVCERLRIELM